MHRSRPGCRRRRPLPFGLPGRRRQRPRGSLRQGLALQPVGEIVEVWRKRFGHFVPSTDF